MANGDWWQHQRTDEGARLHVRTEAGTSYTLSQRDNLRWLRFSASSAVTVTIAPQASENWQSNAEITVEQNGTGQVTVSPGAGVTIRTINTAKTVARYGVIQLKRVGVDEWVCTGDRALS